MQTITLVAEDGTEHAVRAELSIHVDGHSGLRSWSGGFASNDDLFDAVGQTMIVRMPDGREGQALLTSLTSGGGGFLQGTGPAPFGS